MHALHPGGPGRRIAAGAGGQQLAECPVQIPRPILVGIGSIEDTRRAIEQVLHRRMIDGLLHEVGGDLGEQPAGAHRRPLPGHDRLVMVDKVGREDDQDGHARVSAHGATMTGIGVQSDQLHRRIARAALAQPAHRAIEELAMIIGAGARHALKHLEDIAIAAKAVGETGDVPIEFMRREMLHLGAEPGQRSSLIAAPRQKRSHGLIDRRPRLAQGDEMGRFQLGSTVVMLFPQRRLAWNVAWASRS